MQRRRRRPPAGSPVLDEPTTSNASITQIEEFTHRLCSADYAPIDQTGHLRPNMNNPARSWSTSSFNFPKLSLLQSFFLLILFASTNFCHALERVHEYQRFDGWYNNLANPQWGSVGSRLHRDAPSNYADGVYKMQSDLPSARKISNLVFKGTDGLRNQRNMTTMLAFFSQVVAYEMMQSTQISCPLELHKIPVPKGDAVFDRQEEGNNAIPFTRAKYDKATGHGLNSPREQVNDRTAWLDANFLYGTQEPWIGSLRSFENGTLLEHKTMKGYPPFNDPHIPMINPVPPQIHRPMNPERQFILGDPRVNENPGLLSFGLILYRWHNYQAHKLLQKNPKWTDEELFQGARRMVIATLQKIIYYDFLPVLLNSNVTAYTGYNRHLPSGISHSFATTAFRFPHTIVPPAMFLRLLKDNKCEFRDDVAGFPALRLCQSWWNVRDIVNKFSLEEFVLGMASQIAEAEDNIVVEDLRDFIFGPMHFTRLDVVSSSIMRSRDNGIPPYNVLRANYNLPPKNWSTINEKLFRKDQKKLESLAELYDNDIDRLDAYVGGMLETVGEGPGELFTAIIKDQFLRLRDGDRFWFENTQNKIFSDEDLKEIWATTLKTIIIKTTEIQSHDLQNNVFLHNAGDPCPQPYQVNTSNLEACTPFMRFDHFTGNEVTYIFTCILLGCVPIACIGIGYIYIQRRRKLGLLYEPVSRSIKTTVGNGFHDSMVFSLTNQSLERALKDGKDKRFTISVIEWVNETYCRSVLVQLDFPRQEVRIEKARGGILRRLTLAHTQTISLTVSRSKTHPFVMISVPKNYDMVLRLHNEDDWVRFRAALNGFAKNISENEAETDVLLEAAETKDKRQQKLDHFFRESYSKAFNCPQMNDKEITSDQVGSEEVLQMQLSKVEFADALGMRVNDLFIERMFACMRSDENDFITFQQFLDVLRKFAKGNLKEKLKLVFDMCDRDRDGRVQRMEFVEFVKSLNIAVGVNIDQRAQDDVIVSILHRAGIESDRDYLTYKDFEAIFSQTDDIRRPVGIHLRGAQKKINLEETESLNSFAVTPETESRIQASFLSWIISFLETNRQQIVILFIFYAITFIVFMERFWHYRYENEHKDLRRTMGIGIAITRGAAAAISFSMAVILLTVCQNILTLIRETPIGEFLPLDSAIAFHKIIGITAGIFSTIHTVGHTINFYHVATQSQEGLACLFQEAVFGSNFLPSISYWFFGTLTGITGILLVAVMSIVYVFSMPAVLRQAYHAFRVTHMLNILLYFLTIAHGLPKLLDSPKFFYYVVGPGTIFIIDRIIGMRQQYKQLRIEKAEIYPSDVIYIQFKRPDSFNFRSGQWVRVSCPHFKYSFNKHHAFSIASPPQSPKVELYIKAVGPWTWQLRHEIIEARSNGMPLPLINLQGPFGAGNAEWQNFDVAVMVGGGIGVTPYASTLMDLVKEKYSDNHCNVRCKKVYFLWICPSHKNFEWFVDVLKDVEKLDRDGILEMHVFVTQFFHKFDLRTTVLYICEKHFRGHRGRSMFTGLRATNHFGRPNFGAFLSFLQSRHQETNDIGVFSCGPSSVNKQIRDACTNANRARNAPSFIHRYETF